jgi:four helix bundle protein
MRDHRSLSVWQRADQVTRWVIGISQRNYRPAVRVPFYHLQATALATQLHIARGHALRSTKAFRKHLTLAFASAIEAQELLRTMADSHLVPSAELVEALAALDEVRKGLVALLRQYRHYR